MSKEETEVDIRFKKTYSDPNQQQVYFKGKINTSQSYIQGTWGHDESEQKGEFWLKDISTRHADLKIQFEGEAEIYQSVTIDMEEMAMFNDE